MIDLEGPTPMATARRATTAPTAPDVGVGDRDLDPPRVFSVVRDGLSEPEGYQRLIANPFLALAALIGWAGLVAQVVRAKRLELFLTALASLALVGSLFQYHCLDCGATGRLSHWRGHACERVVARQLAGRRRRLRGPSPTTQTLWWVVVTVLAALFFVIT